MRCLFRGTDSNIVVKNPNLRSFKFPSGRSLGNIKRGRLVDVWNSSNSK